MNSLRHSNPALSLVLSISVYSVALFALVAGSVISKFRRIEK